MKNYGDKCVKYFLFQCSDLWINCEREIEFWDWVRWDFERKNISVLGILDWIFMMGDWKCGCKILWLVKMWLEFQWDCYQYNVSESVVNTTKVGHSLAIYWALELLSVSELHR